MSGKPEKPASQRRLRDLARLHWQILVESALLTVALLLFGLMTVPAVLGFWDGSLAALAGLLERPGLSIASMPLLSYWLPELLLPVAEYPMPAPDHHDWLINIGGSVMLFLLAGLLPATRRTLLRGLCILHLPCVLPVVLGVSPAGSFTSHCAALGVMTLLAIVALPLFLALTHFAVETVLARRLAAWLVTYGYLVAAQPFKLLGHMLILDLLGPLAMPTLFLLFGPALDVLAITAITAWAMSWRRPPE